MADWGERGESDMVKESHYSVQSKKVEEGFRSL